MKSDAEISTSPPILSVDAVLPLSIMRRPPQLSFEKYPLKEKSPAMEKSPFVA